MSEGAGFLAGWISLVLIILLSHVQAISMPAAGFIIDEDDDEPAVRVWNVDYEGNETYNGIVLSSIIALEEPSALRKLKFWDRSGYEFDADELQRDEIRIARFYRRRGFPEVRVTSRVEEGRKEWARRIIFIIDEGAPTIIESLRHEIDADSTVTAYLEDHRDIVRKNQRHLMQEGRRYQLIQHGEVEGDYLSVLQDLGFAYANAYVSADIDSADRSADVLVKLVPGPLTYLGKIEVDGTETVSEEIVLRQSELETGDLYSARSIYNAQQQIFGHPLFRFVTINLPPQPQDSIADISIRVREHPLRSLRILGGIGIEEIIRANVSWLHRNPLGNAHNISISAHASFLEQHANVDYHIPYVFNPKSRINISPFAQRLDERGYLLMRTGINNSFIYQLSRETAGTISYEFTRNREQLHSPEVIIPEEDQFYNVSALKFSGYHNQLELEQYQGWAVRPHAEFSGFLGTGSLRYNRYILDIRRYINIGPTTQFALRNEGGIITFSKREDLPSNIRLYSGGTSSVRGWNRHMLGPKRAILDEEGQFDEYIPIGGKAMYHFNVEIRQGMSWLLRNFGVAFFLDGGSVWEDMEIVKFNEMQFGLGGGLRYNSPIGPVRIDLARKMNPSDQDLNIYNGVDYGNWFDHWGIHFSIGHAF